MVYFTPEEIQQAKQLDLLTYGTTGSIWGL